MPKTKGKKDAPKPDHRRASIENSTTLRMAKNTVSFIEELAKNDSKRKKKTETKKTEDGIVRRLAKQGLIDINLIRPKAVQSEGRTQINLQEEEGEEEEEDEGPWLLLIILIVT